MNAARRWLTAPMRADVLLLWWLLLISASLAAGAILATFVHV